MHGSRLEFILSFDFPVGCMLILSGQRQYAECIQPHRSSLAGQTLKSKSRPDRAVRVA
ncbi:hypothetical protein I2I11_14905 [Pontibacter sp. 172403-2]|uniref:hypothetical protein n=1 Tax=Pontibacter rufus TaxID=2791028 RepID=UPI0018AFFAC5|nr:hypothetical protein [Pontibacter sp. 172403-2]MBF9254592.1 hypothetical protein [Pontibacter sp. 172403-2]